MKNQNRRGSLLKYPAAQLSMNGARKKVNEESLIKPHLYSCGATVSSLVNISRTRKATIAMKLHIARAEGPDE